MTVSESFKSTSTWRELRGVNGTHARLQALGTGTLLAPPAQPSPRQQPGVPLYFPLDPSAGVLPPSKHEGGGANLVHVPAPPAASPSLGQNVPGEAAGPLNAPPASRRSVAAESAAGKHPLTQTLRPEPGDSGDTAGSPAALEEALLWQ